MKEGENIFYSYVDRKKIQKKLWCKLTNTIIFWKSIQLILDSGSSMQQRIMSSMRIHLVQYVHGYPLYAIDIRSSRCESVAEYKYSCLLFDVKWPFPLSIFSAIWAMRFDVRAVLTWVCQPSSLARKWLYQGPS